MTIRLHNRARAEWDALHERAARVPAHERACLGCARAHTRDMIITVGIFSPPRSMSTPMTITRNRNPSPSLAPFSILVIVGGFCVEISMRKQRSMVIFVKQCVQNVRVWSPGPDAMMPALTMILTLHRWRVSKWYILIPMKENNISPKKRLCFKYKKSKYNIHVDLEHAVITNVPVSLKTCCRAHCGTQNVLWLKSSDLSACAAS